VAAQSHSAAAHPADIAAGHSTSSEIGQNHNPMAVTSFTAVGTSRREILAAGMRAVRLSLCVVQGTVGTVMPIAAMTTNPMRRSAGGIAELATRTANDTLDDQQRE
jgi:predicted molibdopterin-dependent oxidoreductase YjgC